MVEEDKEDKKEKKDDKPEKVERLPARFSPFLFPKHTFRMMEKLFDELRSQFERGYWHLPMFENKETIADRRIPKTDIEDLHDRFRITMELPGITRDNVDINLTDNLLEVSASIEEEQKTEKKNYLRVERGYGKFYRKIRLPEDVTPEASKAILNNGLLTIEVPKAKVPEKYRIKIE